MQDSLNKKAYTGIAWTSIGRFSNIAIQFISGIILARLLTPDDYGCIGMLSIFMLIASTFVNGGFGSALIQKKRPTPVDYSTIFFWNVGMSGVMYLILFACAPSIARFYKIPLLCPVLRVEGIVLFINAFMLVQSNQLNKQFKFKKLSIVSVTTSIITLIVTALLAYLGFGVWALVVQNILMALIPCVVYWVSSSWRPTFVFSGKSFKELFSFGFYMLMSNLVNEFCNNIQGLMIGKLYNSATMGYYSKAHSTEKLASTTISNVVMQVSYPVYSELQDDKSRLIEMLKRLTTLLAFVSFPLMFVLILVAEPLFLVLYSDKWLSSVPYFQLLCIAGLATCMQSVNAQSIAAIGKSKVMFRWTIVKQLFGLTMIVGGLLQWGMKGMLVGMVVRSWFVYIVNASLVSKHVGYKLKNQITDLFPILLVSIISYLIAIGVMHVLPINIYVKGILSFIIFFISYLAINRIFKTEYMNNVMAIWNTFISKIKK